MRKVTKWRPDTCECVIEYEWDSEVPPETRMHRPVSHWLCEAHKNIDNPWEVVLEENRRKNEAVNALGHDEYSWNFAEDRQLILQVPEAKRKEAIRTLSNMQRVRVV